MPASDDPEVRAMLRHMPSAWHGEMREKTARSIVERNRAHGMALDSADRLTRDINAFFRGDQAMRPSPSGSAAMPTAFNQNFTSATGGHQFNRRDHNASDQIATAEALLNAFSALPEEVQLQVFQALASFYRVDVGGEEPPAEDQETGSSMRLPAGPGVTPGQFFQGQQTLGTFAERDPLTSPRATADQDPAPIGRLPASMVARELSRRGGGQAEDRRLARDRRIAHDRRFGPDVSPAERHRQFTARFPFVTVDVWR